MEPIVQLYSNDNNEIKKFLQSFLTNQSEKIIDTLKWEKKYQNPLEMADIIGTFIENNEYFKINMWISLDLNVFINVTDYNADKIIRYLYERYPY